MAGLVVGNQPDNGCGGAGVPVQELPLLLPFSAIEARIIPVRSGFEAAVHPKILVGRLADFLLDDGVDPGGILKIIATGEVLQGRVEIDVVARAIFPAEMTEGNHLALAALRNSGCGSNGAGWNPEEGREHDVFPAVVLIRGVPDGPVVFQAAK